MICIIHTVNHHRQYNDHSHCNDKPPDDSLVRIYAENYLYKLLCFKLSSFVIKVEWIEELKQGMVQSKANVCALSYSSC